MLSFVRSKREAMRAAGGPFAACTSIADVVSDQMRAEEHKERAAAAAATPSAGSASPKK